MISASKFVRQFRLIFEDALDASRWQSWNAKAWTDFMLRTPARGTQSTREHRDDGVLTRVAKVLGTIPKCDYLRIDQLWYVPTAIRSPRRLRNYSFRQLVAAIEHENQPHRFMYSLRKLGALNVPLKILIAYPQRNLSTYAMQRLRESANLFLQHERTDGHNIYLLGFGPIAHSDAAPTLWNWLKSGTERFTRVCNK